jgi:hypothetical protein
MLARVNKLKHPLGIEIETPLLIPSFSSKGFGFKKKSKRNKPDISEVVDALMFSREFLTESLLISAYDIHYKHIPFNEDLFVTDITFIDSGGYETGNAYDISATTKYNYDLKVWDLEQLKKVLQKWPEHKAGVIVSYDHGNYRVPLENQINDAEELFKEFPNLLNDFLIKPETKDQLYIKTTNIVKNISKLKKFDIIGITERELGNSILQRMLNLHKIRTALDDEKIIAPIHVFGSLDPITSILYFLAGAEIFDGLTWLKYSYYNSSAIYTSNYGVLNPDLGINTIDSKVKSFTISKNTYYLDKMKYTMRDFLKDKDFKVFDDLGGIGFGDMIEKSYKTFESNL